MRLQRLNITGFRGIREPLSIDIPSGFLIICGRNGAGKSTLCDAIEFAFTGKIRSGVASKEKGESYDDYLWWRGEGAAEKNEVSLWVDADGKEPVEIKRSASSVGERIPLDFLTISELAPSDSIDQLIRTSIIRDEYITQFSVDLQERERFDFAKNALGKIDFEDMLEKAKGLYTYATNRVGDLQLNYQKQRDRISDLTERLSELRSGIKLQGNINEAKAFIQSSLATEMSSQGELLGQARSREMDLRVRLKALESLIGELNEAVLSKQTLETSTYVENINQMRSRIDETKALVTALNIKLEETTVEIANLERSEPLIRSLAELEIHGRRIGIVEGNCPLCGSNVSEKAFSEHLAEIQHRVADSSSNLSELIRKKSQIVVDLTEQDKILRNYDIELNRSLALKEALQSRFDSVSAKAEQLKLVVGSDIEEGPKQIMDYLERTNRDLLQLNNAITILEASGLSDKLIEVEREIDLAKRDSDEISQKLNKAQEIQDKAKAATNTINRISGEIVDEHLSAISPLLSELFTRLRPHIDWNEINYRMRGDVRRFLSLTVGSEINPSFIFSSGQRRALGLAFLLTVYLARSWSKLKTLILDDPVQHIDDYRALHLTEVLSALRKDGHQIICTVEDAALAELLCRRLRSTISEPGLLVELEYSSEKGVAVKEKQSIRPMMKQMMLAS